MMPTLLMYAPASVNNIKNKQELGPPLTAVRQKMCTFAPQFRKARCIRSRGQL